MRLLVLCQTLLLASLGFAQQPRPSTPPYQTPPTFPDGSREPRDQMPPDTKAPPSERDSAAEVEQQIVQHLKSEPTLAKTSVDARVDQDSVMLTGTVDTQTE